MDYLAESNCLRHFDTAAVVDVVAAIVAVFDVDANILSYLEKNSKHM